MARKVRSSNRRPDEVFLDALDKCSRQNHGRVTSETLHHSLAGWSRDKFNSVKTALKASGKITLARGPGSVIARSTPTIKPEEQKKPLKVFISYSHEDSGLKDQFIKHLQPLVLQRLIQPWHDKDIFVGDHLDVEIGKNLKSADIVLLLISIDFVNSTYCYETELSVALERENNGLACVIPVILRDCIWQSSPFGVFKAPLEGKPIDSWPSRDTAFTQIAKSIQTAALNLIDRRALKNSESGS